MARKVKFDFGCEHPQATAQKAHAAVRVMTCSATHDQSRESAHFIHGLLIAAGERHGFELGCDARKAIEARPTLSGGLLSEIAHYSAHLNESARPLT